jgi:hypothetical protein
MNAYYPVFHTMDFLLIHLCLLIIQGLDHQKIFVLMAVKRNLTVAFQLQQKSRKLLNLLYLHINQQTLLTKHNLLYYEIDGDRIELLTIFFTAQDPSKNIFE